MAMTDTYRLDWVAMCTAPGVADNGGSDVIDPDLITRAAITILSLPVKMQYVELRLRYDDAGVITQDVIVQPFGRAPGSSDWNRLRDLSGNDTLALAAASSDVEDGTYKYTATADPWFVGNVSDILVAVKTLLTIDISAGSQIELRPRLF